MNYKVMKRPMFKLGGKAASQGTGITSGLDEKVNMAIGGGVIKGQNMGAREGFQSPELSSILNQMGDMDASALNRFLAERMGSGTGMSDMKDIIRLQALGNLATNVLPNIESGGFTAVTDFLKDPMTTQTAVKGLTGLKQVDLKQKQLEDTALANFVKNQIDIKDKEASRKIAKDAFDLKVKIAEDDKAYKQGVLDLKEKHQERFILKSIYKGDMILDLKDGYLVLEHKCYNMDRTRVYSTGGFKKHIMDKFYPDTHYIKTLDPNLNKLIHLMPEEIQTIYQQWKNDDIKSL